MGKKLTVSEFASEFKFSINTAWKWIKKEGLTTDIERINNREINVILFNDNQYDELFKKRFSDAQGYNPSNEGDYEEVLTAEYTKQPIQQEKTLDMINQLMNEVINSKNQVIKYAEQAGQVKLLEDSESRTKNKYYELLTENNRLKIELEQEKQKNSMLEAENQQLKQKSFFGLKFGK